MKFQIINRRSLAAAGVFYFFACHAYRRQSALLKTIILILGVSSMSACWPGPCNDCFGSNDKPVYMSYETLRTPMTIETDRPLATPGKIYTYSNHLFINEPNQGIHIYDNADSSNPVSKGFIVLPGNLDIAIKDGFLYADSFVDLVVFDLNNPLIPALVRRIENVFSWDPYQAIDPEAHVYFYDLDESKGVVIDYEEI
jgi:hypothetical protein